MDQIVNVVVELLIQDQTKTAVSLLRFPNRFPLEAVILASLNNGLHTINFQCQDANELIQWANQKQNKIHIRYNPVSNVRGESGEWDIQQLLQVFDVSPTNMLWASTSEWSLENQIDNKAAYINLQGQEFSLKQEKINDYPTSLTSHFKIRTSQTENDFLASFSEFLVNSIPSNLCDVKLYGAADYTTLNAPTLDAPQILYSLSRWPHAIKLLGERIDALHPYIIGDDTMCEKIKFDIKDHDLRIHKVPCNSVSHKIAILEVPKTIVDNPEVQAQIREVLVPRNDSVIRNFWGKHPLEEFQIQGRIFYTQQRYDSLLQEGRIRTLSRLKWLPIIRPFYAASLDVSMEKLLVAASYPQIEESIQQKIDDCFEELSSDIPLKERIWNAHMKIWQTLNPPWSPELIYFLRVYFLEGK